MVARVNYVESEKVWRAERKEEGVGGLVESSGSARVAWCSRWEWVEVYIGRECFGRGKSEGVAGFL